MIRLITKICSFSLKVSGAKHVNVLFSSAAAGYHDSMCSRRHRLLLCFVYATLTLQRGHVQQLKSRRHSPYMLVCKDPLLTYHFGISAIYFDLKVSSYGDFGWIFSFHVTSQPFKRCNSVVHSTLLVHSITSITCSWQKP